MPSVLAPTIPPSEFLEFVAEAGQFYGGADAVHLVAGCNEDLICGNTLWLNVFVTNKGNRRIGTTAEKITQRFRFWRIQVNANDIADDMIIHVIKTLTSVIH